MDLTTPRRIPAGLVDPAAEIDGFEDINDPVRVVDEIAAEFSAPLAKRADLTEDVLTRPGYQIVLAFDLSQSDRDFIAKQSMNLVAVSGSKDGPLILKRNTELQAFTVAMACVQIVRQGVVLTDQDLGGKHDVPVTFRHQSMLERTGSTTMKDAVLTFCGQDMLDEIYGRYMAKAAEWAMEDGSVPQP